MAGPRHVPSAATARDKEVDIHTDPTHGRGFRHSPAFLLLVLTVVNAVNWADRQVVAVLFPSIREALDLSDTQLGVIGGVSFAAIYAVSAFFFGHLADRAIRRNVITVGLVIWCLATAASGMADSFGSLFAARFFTGIGEASLYPCAMSLFADCYPAERRGFAMGVFGAATAVGGGIGQGIGGLLAESLGWRQVFFVYGLAGLALVPLVLALPEAPRARTGDGGAAGTIRAVKETLADTRLLAVWAAGTVMISSAIGFSAWLPEFLVRVHDVSASTAGAIAGAGVLLGGISGSVLGGRLSDRRGALRFAGQLDVSTAAALVSAPAVATFVFAPSVAVIVAIGLVTPVAIYCFFPPIQTTIMAIVPKDRMGAVFAVNILFMAGMGTSTGPFLVGMVSDATGSLEAGMLATAAGMLIAAGLATFAGRHVRARTPGHAVA